MIYDKPASICSALVLCFMHGLRLAAQHRNVTSHAAGDVLPSMQTH
jgi:hypothetical protein